MFSATFPTEVQEKAAEYLNDYVFLTIGRVGGANSDVTQSVIECGQFDKREKLLEILKNQPGKISNNFKNGVESYATSL